MIPKCGNVLIVAFKGNAPVGFAVFTLAADKETKELFLYGDGICDKWI